MSFKPFTVKNYMEIPMVSKYNRDRTVCKDGYTMSLQHSECHYCEKYWDSDPSMTPNESSTFEVWRCDYDPEWGEYWNDDEPMGYVPFDVVARVVEKHGGLA